MKQYCMTLFLSAFLAACTSTQQPAVKVDYKPIPNELLQPVEAPIPIDEEEYVKLSWNDKEKVLHRSVLALYHALSQANVQIKAIADWDSTLRNTHNNDTPVDTDSSKDKPDKTKRE
jgi:lipoprotein